MCNRSRKSYFLNSNVRKREILYGGQAFEEFYFFEVNAIHKRLTAYRRKPFRQTYRFYVRVFETPFLEHGHIIFKEHLLYRRVSFERVLLYKLHGRWDHEASRILSSGPEDDAHIPA